MTPKVLVVDDDPDILDSLTTLLKYQGCHSEGAANRDLANVVLERKTFDLIIVDYMMFGMPLQEFVENVRSRSPATHMIVFSAYVGARVEADALGLPFVWKPFEWEALKAAAGGVLLETSDEHWR